MCEVSVVQLEERCACNAEALGSSPNGYIARAVNSFKNQTHQYHPPTSDSPRNYEAAASSTCLYDGFPLHSPLAAATIYLQKVRRAIRQNLCHLFLRKRGDEFGELVFPCKTHLSTPTPPILSRFVSSPSHNHFLQSSSAEQAKSASNIEALQPSGKPEISNIEATYPKLGTHESAAMPCDAP